MGFIDIVAIDITDIVPKIMKQSLEVNKALTRPIAYSVCQNHSTVVHGKER